MIGILVGMWGLERVMRPGLDPAAFAELSQKLASASRKETRAPGTVDVDRTPTLTRVTKERPRFVNLRTGPGWQLRIMGWTRIDAHVFSVDAFHHDVVKALSPLDYALGWQAAATPEAVSRISAMHFTREASFKGMNAGEARSLTNMHLIPGSVAIFDAMREVVKGDSIALVGYPVKVSSRRLFLPWTSDMSYGDANCEIVVVTGIRVESAEERLKQAVDLRGS